MPEATGPSPPRRMIHVVDIGPDGSPGLVLTTSDADVLAAVEAAIQAKVHRYFNVPANADESA